MIGIKFIKVQPTIYLLQYRGGKVVREGQGLSFFYYSPTTSLVAVPVASTDTPFIFQETTADFQAVTIQGQVVVTLGQDGLVANTLKYLDGQPVVGVNPDPERWDGRLLTFRLGDLPKVMPDVVLRKRPTRTVTMAKAALNNGQTLYGVNDLFIGPKTHCSARYLIRSGEASETQSSSGVIVSTGMGSTGWLKSLLTDAAAIVHASDSRMEGRQAHVYDRSSRRKEALTAQVLQEKNEPRHLGCYDKTVAGFDWNANYLFYTVREPFPTKTTGASLVFGRVTPETPLILESRMAENGVIFSDGIEKDFLEFNSGTQAVIGIAERKGVLVE